MDANRCLDSGTTLRRAWRAAMVAAAALLAAVDAAALVPMERVTAVSGGQFRTCAVVDGGVQCWGAGSLGDGGSSGSVAPVIVIPAGSGVTAVANGSNHACAVVNGGVKCWGSGIGTGPAGNTSTPADALPAGSGVTALSTGQNHTCVVANGGVRCWGPNTTGALGIGTINAGGSTPVDPIPPGSGATAVRAGTNHTCAIVNGGVLCWGGSGNLGDGNSGLEPDQPSPVQVIGLGPGSGATALGGGRSHTCAVVSGGVKCWGSNNSGALGDGSSTPRYAPVDVCASPQCTGPLTGATAVSPAAHGDHTCAVVNGGVRCWGTGLYGELGNGATANFIRTPVDVVTLPPGSGATSVAVGQDHSCAVVGDRLHCWGSNNDAQLSNGTQGMYSVLPVQALPAGSGATSVATGNFNGWGHTCAVIDGGVQCWGSDYLGKLGDGASAAAGQGSGTHEPVVAIAAGSNATAVAAGGSHTCAVVAGAIFCWGERTGGRAGNGVINSGSYFAPVPSGITSGAVALAAGSAHTCAVANGGVQCWGNGTSGRLGHGSTASSPVPVVAVNAAAGATAVTVGESHSCAVVAGAVHCWGDNGYGQLGNGTNIDSSVPVPVTGITSGATALASSQYHTCAVVNGGVRCWGRGGALGDGSTAHSNVPVVALADGSGATAIAAGNPTSGAAHTCAVVNGGVRCWGEGGMGQLGYGYTADSGLPIVAIADGSGVTAIGGGGARTCVVVNGGVDCWGSGEVGELGDGKTGFATDAYPVYTRATPGIALSASPPTPALGVPVTLTATLQPGELFGTVVFKDGTSTLATVGLAAGVATFVKSNFTAGFHTLTATYSGDLDHFGRVSAPLVLPVGGPTITLAPAAMAAGGFGSPYSTQLVAAGGTSPYTYAIVAGTLPGGLALTPASGMISGTLTGVGSASFTARATDAAGYWAERAYTIVVNPAVTSLALAAAPTSPALGQAVTLTASVTPATATGSLTFKDGAATLGSAPIVAGSASFATSTLAAGPHSLTAEYGGDHNHAASTSNAALVTVGLGATNVALTSSANPSTLGQVVTFTATVTGASPTGTVEFRDGNAPMCAAQTLSGAQAACAINTLPAGSHDITAVYSGDASNAGSTSAILVQGVTVVAGPTTTTLTSVPNPSTPGQAVTFTATVSGTAPTGTVEFRNGAVPIAGCTAQPLNAAQAACATSALGAGTHAITAVYSGDAANAGSTSAALEHVVTSGGILVGYWAGNGNPADSSGFANHGTSNGATFASGVRGQAFRFDGTSNISIPGAGKYQFGTGDFSVAFWVLFDDLAGNDSGIVHKDNYPDAGYRGWLFNICELCSQSGAGMGVRDSGSALDADARTPVSGLATGRWYHFTGVRSGTTMRLYVDGVEVAAAVAAAVMNVSNPGELNIGSLSGGSRQYLNGAVDEVRLYDYALSPSEVQGLAGIRGVAKAYVANQADNTVSVIDTASNAVTATIALPTPGVIAVDAERQRVYVVVAPNSLAVVDARTNLVTATIPVGAGPGGVALNAAGTRAYVPSQYDHNVSVIDTTTHAVIATIPIATGFATNVAAHPSANRIYVGDQFNTVYVIDTDTNTVIAGVGVGQFVGQLAVHPAGTYVYTANINGNSVSVIDTATNAVVATVPVGPGCMYCGPGDVAVHPEGTYVYAPANGDRLLYVIRTSDHTVVATVPTGSFPYDVGVHPDGASLYLSNYDDGTVTVIATATNTVSETIAVGAHPTGVALIPRAPAASIALASSLDPSPVGASVTFTATVTGAAPSGSVRFKGGAAVIAGCDAVPLSGGQAACATNALAIGAHAISAVYSGDGNNGGAVSAALAQTVNVAGAGGLTAVAGTPQSTFTSTAYAVALQARLTDTVGNPMPGVSVTFATPTTGPSGTFTGGARTAIVVTGADGVATAPSLTATGTAGSFAATAQAGALSTSFALTNVARTGATIAATSGTPQTTVVNTAYGSPLVVAVRDAANAPVAGVAVTFTLPGGTGASGTFATGGTVRIELTDAGGVAASPAITANTRKGTFTVNARAPGISAAATFSLTNAPDVPATMTARVGAQSADVYATFARAPSVLVRDQFGNTIAGAIVAFAPLAATVAGATWEPNVTGTPQQLVATDAAGIATAPVLVANRVVGSHAVIATLGALPAVSFALTNRVGSTSTVTLVQGSPQSTVAGTAYALPLGVLVRTAAGLPVENAQATFTLPNGTLSGTFPGATPASVVLFTLGDGTATSPAITAKTRSGTFNARVVVAGISGSLQLPLTVLPDVPVALQANGVGAQSSTVNTAFANAPSVRVVDTYGNRVPGVTVTFEVPQSGASGAFAGGPTMAIVTDANGVATMPPVTANSTLGIWYVTASGVGTPVTFRMTNVLGSGATIAAAGGTPQSTPRGSAFGVPLQALVRDGAGNPVAGVTVTFTLPSSATTARFQPGNVRTTTAVTGTDGIATPSLTPTAGTAAVSYTATATASGTTGPATFDLTNL